MKLPLKIGLCAALILGFTAQVSAATYKWVDKDGNVHYSQQPPTSGNYETLRIQTRSPSGSSSSSPSYTSPSPSSSDTNGADAIKQVEAKSEEQRQKNCENAKQALETYTVYRRIRDKDGNVIRLDDNERAKRIENAKAAIKEFCE